MFLFIISKVFCFLSLNLESECINIQWEMYLDIFLA